MPARAGASCTPAICAAYTTRGAAGGCSSMRSTLQRSPSPRCSKSTRLTATLRWRPVGRPAFRRSARATIGFAVGDDGFVASQLGDGGEDGAPVARPRTRRRVPDRRVAHRVHGEALQHRHTQPEAVDGECPRPGLLVRSMIDPMATDTVKRPPTDLRRPRGREALSTHPPTPADDTTSGSLERRKWSSDAVSARGKRTCGPQECLCGVDPSIERPIMVVRRRRRRECRHRDGPLAVWRRAAARPPRCGRAARRAPAGGRRRARSRAHRPSEPRRPHSGSSGGTLAT